MAIDVRANSIADSAPAIGAAFDLDFDPTALTYDSFIPGNFFESSNIPANGSIVRLVAMQDGIPGKLLIGISQNAGDPGASGSGTLLTLKFRITSGANVIQSNISLSMMNLIDINGMFIPELNWYNAQVAQHPLEILTASLPQETQGSSMMLSLTASGGFPPYKWNKTSGSLAPGLSLNADTGVISGTPSASGSYSFTAMLTDSTSQKITRDLTLVINPAPKIVTTSLPGITVNQAYNQTLSASGGTAPLAWDILSGTLPAGITLNSATGTLKGAPAESGAFSFTVRLRDSKGSSATSSLSINIYQNVLVTTSSLPDTTAGASYSSILQVQGGSAPYTWTITSGLPTGLNLMPDTGEILGITSAAGNWGFTVTVRDKYGATAAKMLSIMVYPAPAITTTSIETLYQDSTGPGLAFAAAGGVSPYSWGLASGSLPPGLTLDAQTGTVSGTPAKPGIYTFTIRTTDAVGIEASTEYKWVILAAPPGNIDFATPGSVNRVDGYDLIALVIALGTTSDSTGWNPLADFNNDQVIDSADLNILLNNFGKSHGQ